MLCVEEGSEHESEESEKRDRGSLHAKEGESRFVSKIDCRFFDREARVRREVEHRVGSPINAKSERDYPEIRGKESSPSIESDTLRRRSETATLNRRLRSH